MNRRSMTSRPSTQGSRAWRLGALVSSLLLLLLLGAFVASPAVAEGQDAKAQAIAERVLEAMGGNEAWEQTRYFRFDFFGFRTHYWDRYTGRHRLEGKNREGQSYVILHNVQTREGEAYLDGQKLEGEQLAQQLEGAYRAWINDTYWLLMPYKLRDPGVHLSYDGEADIDGKSHDRLKLQFDGVGVTPGDTYWAYIDRDSGLMVRWEYFLQGWEEGRERTAWDWQGWARYGDIMLAPTRVRTEDGTSRELGNLAVFSNLDDAVFASSKPVEGPAALPMPAGGQR